MFEVYIPPSYSELGGMKRLLIMGKSKAILQVSLLLLCHLSSLDLGKLAAPDIFHSLLSLPSSPLNIRLFKTLLQVFVGRGR